MNLIQEGLQKVLPPKKKLTPSGWTSFNAPCCHNKGESRDTRQRGGLLLNPNGGFSYHCFNCTFKTGWIPGQLISENTKNLLQWLGMSDSDISQLRLYALKFKEDIPQDKKFILSFELEDARLPEDTFPLTDWFKQNNDQYIEEQLVKVVEYITNERGMNLDWYPWHYSYLPGYRDRVIIPFYYRDRIVGFTARKIISGKPKYLTDSQPGYVFNIDNQIYDKKFAILVEGQLDAIAIEGMAVMSNTPSETQCSRINALGKEIIVVPDRDRAGSKLLRTALENNWSVSLPPWEEHIKDVADAVKHYGRLYTLFTILHYKETNKIKIELLKKRLENTHE